MSDTQEKKIDKLRRRDFVKFVENLILNSDNYKRDNDSNSYVMALDSAWGTGKSYFIDLLIQDIEEQDEIFVVKYNAWANDYCDNAFNPLIYDILNAECLKFSTKTDADIEATKQFLKNVFDIGKSFVKKSSIDFLESKTGINIGDILEKVKKDINIKEFLHGELPNLSELNEQRIAFENFKQYLSNATEWMKDNGSKLVVIIDELDRCKPTFAIQTLEIVKHIFDVENIVFLFAVDIEQLSHSISCVYGQGFDSVGYLCRFFDYIAKLPAPNIYSYVESELANIDTIYDKATSSYRADVNICSLHEDISEYITLLFKDFRLSLRDLDTIIKNYKIMIDNFLKDYRLSLAHVLYLFYLTLKYKRPDLFDGIFIDQNNESDFVTSRDIIKNYASFKVPSIIGSWRKIFSIEILSKFRCQCCDFKGENTSNDMYIAQADEEKISLCTSVSSSIIKSVNNEKTFNYGNVLFSPDFKKWEQIKNYTYREYMHKQLENYNFVNVESTIEE